MPKTGKRYEFETGQASGAAEGINPDPVILSFDETYEGKRADL